MRDRGTLATRWTRLIQQLTQRTERHWTNLRGFVSTLIGKDQLPPLRPTDWFAHPAQAWLKRAFAAVERQTENLPLAKASRQSILGNLMQ